MTTPHPTPPRRRCPHGVTLIEVMIGMTLGMIVSAALLMVFANASSKNANVQRSSSQIENGRFLAELMRDELQLAGYWGELVQDGAAFSTPDPCETTPSGFTAAPLTLPTPVRGYGAAEALACLTSRNRAAGTDALAVRRVDITTIDPGTLATANLQYHLQSSFCNDDPSATPLVFDRTAASFTLRARSCGSTNVARPYVARTYFVAACNDCSGSGDGIPTLKRLDLVGNQLVETALVEGIEAMRIEYGFDSDNDGNVDSWRTAAATSGPESLWENVMALRVHYIVRSLERVSGGSTSGAQSFVLGGVGTISSTNDGYSRRAYSLTVRLINPSGARETS